MNSNNQFIPLCEKFRPTNFDDIVLDPLNKNILRNIIETSYFPNLLFYGPPGTGKTTTIINLVNSYQIKNNQQRKGLMIHLNASDERGIDIIRNQINQFVNTKNLFNQGMKFVILDEVDYMTKNAQQALRYLLQSYSNNVRFCLICNYISRIDEGLQNEFLKLRFNQLPEPEIINFLNNISMKEELNLSMESLKKIQRLYKSDIRSMINFIQLNQNIDEINIIDNHIWEKLYADISNISESEKYINSISLKYNIDKKNIIKDFINYIIRKYPITSDFLLFVEHIMHFQDLNNNTYINYSLLRLSSFITKEL
jgi:replication factor C subunit 3/5